MSESGRIATQNRAGALDRLLEMAKDTDSLNLRRSDTFTTSSYATVDRNKLAVPDVSSDTPHPSTTQMIRDASSGGGRLGKSKRTWANLPSNIIHKILDYVMIDNEPHWTLHDAWRGDPRSYETALSISGRLVLGEMRTLARAWKHAVDSHSFWPEYTLILDPSKSHGSIVADLHSSRLTPSTPTFSTLFHRARSTTLDICLPCRLNYPDRLGLYPAARRNLTASNPLGLVPTCNRHRENYCTSCLRERDYVNRERLTPIMLLNVRGDVDDEGYSYRSPTICQYCRTGAISVHVDKVLTVCARGTGTRATAHSVEDVYDFTQDVVDTTRTVVDIARNAVRQCWIRQQTCFEELDPYALKLQDLEDRVRLSYLTNRRTETRAIRGERAQQLCEMYDEEWHTLQDKFVGILDHINELYEDWALDEEEFSAEDFAYEPSEYLLSVQRDAAMYRWTRDRIRSGHWIYPSDEVDMLVSENRQSHAQVVRSARLPLHVEGPSYKAYVHKGLGGYIQLEPDNGRMSPGDYQLFLPPKALLGDLDQMFYSTLSDYITSPFVYHAETRFAAGWRLEEFAKSPPTSMELLEYLRVTGACWGPFEQELLGSSNNKRPSPRIEALPLEDQDIDDNRFKIEVESETSSLSTDESGSGDSEETTSEELLDTVAGNHAPHPNPLSQPTDQDPAPPLACGHDASSDLTPNGKRKSPPVVAETGDAEPLERPTKRRPSVEEPETGVPMNKERGKSTDSTNSSASASLSTSTPSDLMPVTPDPLESETIVVLPHTPIEDKPKIEERIYVSKRDIPHIPLSGTFLGHKTERLFAIVYERTWEPLRVCKCRICERGRLQQQMLAAGAQWSMEEILAMSERNQ